MLRDTTIRWPKFVLKSSKRINLHNQFIQFSNCIGKWGTANSMPLIRACWHFNCWRFILNLQNLNLLVWKVEALFHFLWSGIPQSLSHNHRGSYIRWAWIPISRVNPTSRDESVIQPSASSWRHTISSGIQRKHSIFQMLLQTLPLNLCYSFVQLYYFIFLLFVSLFTLESPYKTNMF